MADFVSSKPGSNCSRMCPKDKAVRRFTVRNMIESAAIRDLSEASVYPGASMPASCRNQPLTPRSAPARRVRAAQALPQDPLLHFVRHPLARCARAFR